MSDSTRLGFYQRLLEASSGQGNTLPKGLSPNASGKTKFEVSIPTEYEPFSPLTLGSQTQQKGRGVSVPFFLGRMGPRAVLGPRHSLLNTQGSDKSREMAHAPRLRVPEHFAMRAVPHRASQ